MRASKLAAVALSAAYFFAANCRFICAAGVPDIPVAAAEGSCHHQGESQDQSEGSAPLCCTNHLDSSSALLPVVVSFYDASVLMGVLPLAVSGVLLPLPRPAAYWEDRGPPLTVSQVLASSSSGPRAPPSFLVVL